MTEVSLLKADFVRSRGGITRAETDKTPLTVSGTITLAANGTSASAAWKGSDADATDALTARKDSGATPIFAIDRTRVPVNTPPTGGAKTSTDSLFQSYRDLPAVAPYANDPDFKAGIGYAIVDKTDFDFYQAHPKALRVVNKVVDAPSLGETLARATASTFESASQSQSDAGITFSGSPSNGTWASDGGMLALTTTCGTNKSSSTSFTASGNTLKLYAPVGTLTFEQVYTK